jgi:hypothetical protein
VFIPEGVGSFHENVIFRNVENDLAMRDIADVTGGTSISVKSQSISGVSVNPSRLLRHPWKKGRGAFVLFCPVTPDFINLSYSTVKSTSRYLLAVRY